MSKQSKLTAAKVKGNHARHPGQMELPPAAQHQVSRVVGQPVHSTEAERRRAEKNALVEAGCDGCEEDRKVIAAAVDPEPPTGGA